MHSKLLPRSLLRLRGACYIAIIALYRMLSPPMLYSFHQTLKFLALLAPQSDPPILEPKEPTPGGEAECETGTPHICE